MQTKQAIWLGSKKNSKTKYTPHLKIIWDPHTFKILGIWFTPDLKQGDAMNYNNKFDEIKNLFKMWLQRMITPLGRVAV